MMKLKRNILRNLKHAKQTNFIIATPAWEASPTLVSHVVSYKQDTESTLVVRCDTSPPIHDY